MSRPRAGPRGRRPLRRAWAPGQGADYLRAQVEDLHPGYAALVMATGIVSTGLAVAGRHLLSDGLFTLALIAFAVLLVAYAWRLVAYPRRALADARDPARGFGYFTLVAAANVVGVRLALAGHPFGTALLGLASLPVWLVLTYAIPGYLIIGPRVEAVLPRANGSWFMWVVGTQSLAAATATVATAFAGRTASLAPVAVSLWGIGVVLYLMLAGLIMVTLLDDPTTPHALSPTYWVYMGATAITVLGAARILALPVDVPVVAETRQVVAGLAFLLWAFGSWWIPLLAFFGVWQLMTGGASATYAPTLWSMVFPLGMYAVASLSFGRMTGLGFMVDIARVELWVAFAAWLVVAAAMVLSLLVARAGPSDPTAPAAAPARSGEPRSPGRTIEWKERS